MDVSIAAPPADGEANAELIRYLAEVLELKKSHLSLDKVLKVPEVGLNRAEVLSQMFEADRCSLSVPQGSRSRDKLIRVESTLSPEEVLRRLQEAAG